MNTLYLITARGGSKGLPGKNIKSLGTKPLLCYSIDVARELTVDSHICLSTDSDEIIRVANDYGLKVPFVRPLELASDTSGSREVILHALEYYARNGVDYDTVVLLQPTTPFRKKQHIQEMLNMFTDSIDMIVSVKVPHVNPYFSLFEENPEGFLQLSKSGTFSRRQDCPAVYAYNGSVYVINASSLKTQKLNEFKRIKKYVMDEIHSIDIDNQFDWWVAEMILEKSLWRKNQ